MVMASAANKRMETKARMNFIIAQCEIRNNRAVERMLEAIVSLVLHSLTTDTQRGSDTNHLYTLHAVL
jgi:hypothetical protein